MATHAETARRQSIVLAALAAYAGKHIDKDHLAPASYAVDLAITGRLDRATIDLEIAGDFSISPDTSRTNKIKPDLEHLVALLLSHLPKSRRQLVLRDLTKHHNQHGQLPGSDDEFRGLARELIESLTTECTKSAAGPKKFIPIG